MKKLPPPPDSADQNVNRIHVLRHCRGAHTVYVYAPVFDAYVKVTKVDLGAFLTDPEARYDLSIKSGAAYIEAAFNPGSGK